MQITSHHNCTRNPIHQILDKLVRYWKPPPAFIIDLTAGLNHSIKGLFNTDLDGNSYTILRNDIDPHAKADLYGDFRRIPKKYNAKADLLYFDPPYAQTKGNKSLNEKGALGRLGILEQYSKGVENINEYLHDIPQTAKRLLAPNGGLLVKLQDRQSIPHITPTVFRFNGYMETRDFILHDYAVYTYFSLRPSMPMWINAKRTLLAHGFLLYYVNAGGETG